MSTSLEWKRREWLVTFLLLTLGSKIAWPLAFVLVQLHGLGELGVGGACGDLGLISCGVFGCLATALVHLPGLGRHLRLYLTANLETVVTRLVISSCSCFRVWWVRTAKCCLMASISILQG